MHYNLKLEVDVRLDIDSKNEVRVLECRVVHQEPVADSDEEYVKEHKLSDTQRNFGILTLGKKFAFASQAEITIRIEHDGESTDYPAVTHKSVKGRIDGITKLYREHRDFFSATKIKAVYQTAENLLILSSLDKPE